MAQEERIKTEKTSGDPELDAMIRKARRWDMATAAMQGMITAGWDSGDTKSVEGWRDQMAHEAIRYADALLSALDQPTKEGGEG